MHHKRNFTICLLLLLIFLTWIQNSPAQVTLRHKIAQMLMVGFANSGLSMDTLLVDIQQRKLGGVILFQHNLLNPAQITQLTTQLSQYAETPLFIATDQEGGRVARLDENNGFEESYSAYQLGTVFNNEDSTRSTAGKMAGWLAQSGINVNLAPVVDVNVNPNSPAIGRLKRSFSADPMIVFQHAHWFIDEFQHRNVISTLKHFPGHGSASYDSHLGLTDITATWTETELIPYLQLFASGYNELVMIGHLYNAQLDSAYPASLSQRFIQTLLRDELGFQGVAVSDEMLMGAITTYYTFDEAIELAINAGMDILLYSTNFLNDLSLVRQFVDIVEQKVEGGLIAESRIDEAYSRIISLKQKLTSVPPVYVKRTLPETISLQNYPNPFNASTTISISINRPGRVSLTLFNSLGQVVDVLLEKEYVEHAHNLIFHAEYLPSGVYFLKLENGDLSAIHKIALVR